MRDKPAVLSLYGLNPTKVENVTERVAKIAYSHHTYALKESRLTKQTLEMFLEVYGQANQYNLASVIPISMTTKGMLTVLDEGIYYYLTPWIIEDNIKKQEKIERMCRALGSIHDRTKQTTSLDAVAMKKIFRAYRDDINQSQFNLLACVESFEKHHYMAPVELCICTHYHEIVNLITVLKAKIDAFVESMTEDVNWSYSLCHGRPCLSHCLVNENVTYFINWEQAMYDNPVMDIYHLWHTLIDDNMQIADILQAFSVYQEQNTLSVSEINLLAIYVLNPLGYIKRVTQYQEAPSEYRQIELIRQLEQSYRRLSFAINWVRQVNNTSVQSTED